jgi:aryl-alcohol dehydrogenase-like predicted oxidoreductase
VHSPEQVQDGEEGAVSSGGGRLALGTVQLGMAYGAGNTTGLPSADEATEIVHLAVESGIRVLDTAHGYGLSEERIGQALKSLSSEVPRPVVVTKIDAACSDADSTDESRSIVQQSLQTSRERLQMETLDTVLLHHFRMYTDHDGAAWEVLREAKAQGIVGRIGCSTYHPAEVMEALSDPAMEHIQLPFNLLASPFKSQEFVRAAAARPDVTIHVRSIFLQGLLVADRSRWPAFGAQSFD